jgi:hypothetical protein
LGSTDCPGGRLAWIERGLLVGAPTGRLAWLGLSAASQLCVEVARHVHEMSTTLATLSIERITKEKINGHF